MTARLAPRWPLLAAAGFAASATLAATFVVGPALATAPRPDLLALAVVVDLALLAPLAVGAALWVRGARPWSALPFVGLGLAAAWLALPEAHRSVLDPLLVLLPVVEIAALASVAVAFVRLARRGARGDPADRIAVAAARVIGENPAGRAAAYELSVLRFALGPVPAPADGAFTARRSSGYGVVLAGLAVGGLIELVGGHLLVRHLWSDGAALAHLAISGYALLWLVGDWRALGSRGTVVDGDTLRVRCGLRWHADVPVSAIETVYHVRRDLPNDRPTVSAVAFGRPRFALDLGHPVVATGPYGVRREVTRIALGADDPDRFVREIGRAMAEASGAPPFPAKTPGGRNGQGEHR